MRVVLQRVNKCAVEINGEVVSSINNGFLLLLGVKDGDCEADAMKLAKKISGLRIFTDENDKMNLALKDINGELLIISQFTLYADCSHGNRPSFIGAAKPEQANELYEYFCDKCTDGGFNVEKGIFGAEMKVSLLNDGPVTIIIDSNERKK